MDIHSFSRLKFHFTVYMYFLLSRYILYNVFVQNFEIYLCSFVRYAEGRRTCYQPVFRMLLKGKKDEFSNICIVLRKIAIFSIYKNCLKLCVFFIVVSEKSPLISFNRNYYFYGTSKWIMVIFLSSTVTYCFAPSYQS